MTYLATAPLQLAEPGIAPGAFVARFNNAALAIAPPPVEPESLGWDCLRIVNDGAAYRLVSKGVVRVVRNRKNQRPSKLGRSKEWAARPARELLTELVTPGSDAYSAMLDADVWQLGVRYATEARLDGNATFILSRALNLLLIQRAGGSIDARDIP